MALKPSDNLIAAPRGSAEEAIAFFQRVGSWRFEHVTLYVETMYDIGPKVGLDPAILVAHAALETNYFRDKWWVGRLNPAGMGVTGEESQNEASPYFQSGEASARAHAAHMVLYATGEIPSPLTPNDDPRYIAYVDAYGKVAMAETLEDLTMKWAWDAEFHNNVARRGNEIFPNLPDSQPRDETMVAPSTILYQGQPWDGFQSVRINNAAFRALGKMVTVNVDVLNIRRYANTTSDILRTATHGEQIPVIGWVRGQNVANEDRWWISKTHERIWAGGTSEKP